MRNLVLIGFMGAGKSVAGQALAKRLARPCVDVDAEIEQETGRPIRRLFAEEGAPAFRQAERAMIRRVTRQTGQVIATGGGAVMDPENLRALRRHGWLVWLRAAPDVILARIGGDVDRRPLLNVADPKARIEGLLALRQATYATADVTVETSARSMEDVVEEILRLLPAEMVPPSDGGRAARGARG